LREFHHLSQTLDDIRILDAENPFDHILEAVVRIIGFDRAILFLKDPEEEILRAVHAFNLDEQIMAQMIVRKSDGPSMAWKVMMTGEPVILNNPTGNPEVNQKILEMMRAHVLALAPISRGGTTWGLLIVDRHLSAAPISDDDLLQLQVIADQVSITFQNHSLHEELSKKAKLLESQNAKTQQELALAKLVQDSVLPRSSPDWKGVKIDSCIRPARFIGGDFFRYLEGCREGKYLCAKQSCKDCPEFMQGILIGDVCGKGIPAALIMAVVNCLFQEKVCYFSDPAHIMNEVNLSLKEFMGAESRFNSSAFLGFFLPNDGKFIYTNAGHDFPIFYHNKTKSIRHLESTGTLLGIFKESTYTSIEIDVASQDRILLYTDGLIDFFERSMNVYDGFEHLQKLIIQNIDSGKDNFLEGIEKTIDSKDEEPSDDITAAIMIFD